MGHLCREQFAAFQRFMPKLPRGCGHTAFARVASFAHGKNHLKRVPRKRQNDKNDKNANSGMTDKFVSIRRQTNLVCASAFISKSRKKEQFFLEPRLRFFRGGNQGDAQPPVRRSPWQPSQKVGQAHKSETRFSMHKKTRQTT